MVGPFVHPRKWLSLGKMAKIHYYRRMQKHPRMARKAGFTILELSVVLTVIALIAGSALAVGASRIQAAKIEDTQVKMSAILETLDNFVKNYGYLPCPANPTALTTDNDFGDGRVTNGACSASNILSSGTTMIGVVPTVTLGLAPSVGLDGWNRRITYVIDERLAATLGWNTINPDNTIGWITILSAKAPQLTTVTDKAVMLLISHGQNGHGAWRAKGGSPLNKNLNDAEENENINIGAVDSTFVQKFLTEDFDDVVYYRLKWQFPAYNP